MLMPVTPSEAERRFTAAYSTLKMFGESDNRISGIFRISRPTLRKLIAGQPVLNRTWQRLNDRGYEGLSERARAIALSFYDGTRKAKGKTWARIKQRAQTDAKFFQKKARAGRNEYFANDQDRSYIDDYISPAERWSSKATG